MNIIRFFKHKKECHHNKVSPLDDFAYCPDCGKLIENKWFLVRCECCGIKLKAVIKDGIITAEGSFCHNCGGKHFVAEQIPKINCIDINYAVLVKSVIEPTIEEYTQSWINIDQSNNKLLIEQT